MQGDFHVHTVFSPDSLLELTDIAAIVIHRRIGCIAVTDHNTIDGAKELQNMDLSCKVIIGEEISTLDGEIIGLFLKEAIPAGLSVIKTIQLIRNQQGLVVLPHPCDRLRHHVLTTSLWNEVLPLVDLVEGFNGRTVFIRDDESALSLAGRFHKLVIGGSDSHTRWEFGRCGMIIDEFRDATEMMLKIDNARFFGQRTTPWIHAVTKGVKYVNRIGLRNPVKGRKRWQKQL